MEKEITLRNFISRYVVVLRDIILRYQAKIERKKIKFFIKKLVFFLRKTSLPYLRYYNVWVVATFGKLHPCNCLWR